MTTAFKTTKQDFFKAIDKKADLQKQYDQLWSTYGRICFEAPNAEVVALDEEMRKLQIKINFVTEVIADIRSEFSKEELKELRAEYYGEVK